MRDVIAHYDRLIEEENDPVRDPEPLRAYMDRWDGAGFLDRLQLTPDKTVLSYSQIKKEGYGATVLRVTMSNQDFFRVYSDYIAGMEKHLRNEMGITGDITYGTCYMTVTVKKGQVRELTMYYEIDTMYEGAESKIIVHTTTKVNNPGKDVSLRLPVSADKYSAK